MYGSFPIGSRPLAETLANALVLGRVHLTGFAPWVPTSARVSLPPGTIHLTGYDIYAGSFIKVQPNTGTVYITGLALKVRTNAARVMHAHLNILEASTVSLTQGEAHAAFPLKRVYDRRVAQPFKTSTASTMEILINQGASPVEVNRLLIPDGHNLDGLPVSLQYSGDQLEWNTASAFTPSNSVIDVAFPAVTARYWKFVVTSPGRIVTLPEIFLTSVYEWARQPQRPGGDEEPVLNATSIETVAGERRFIVNGPSRRQLRYTLKSIPEAQKNAIMALYGAWGGGNPVWVFSHRGAWILGEITSPLKVSEVALGRFDMTFEFLEVI